MPRWRVLAVAVLLATTVGQVQPASATVRPAVTSASAAELRAEVNRLLGKFRQCVLAQGFNSSCGRVLVTELNELARSLPFVPQPPTSLTTTTVRPTTTTSTTRPSTSTTRPMSTTSTTRNPHCNYDVNGNELSCGGLGVASAG